MYFFSSYIHKYNGVLPLLAKHVNTLSHYRIFTKIVLVIHCAVYVGCCLGWIYCEIAKVRKSYQEVAIVCGSCYRDDMGVLCCRVLEACVQLRKSCPSKIVELAISKVWERERYSFVMGDVGTSSFTQSLLFVCQVVVAIIFVVVRYCD